ncbi:hypothetical protein V6N11_069403 [Hibiscus sabdariffa]|uniref:Rhomboid-like protein n=2 Tax=Hibiscus sabdariffa TaxID=183260 RepID=A0ABR1Z9G8_9ROSI
MAALDIESRRGGVKRNNTSSASTYLMEHTETQWTSWLVPVFVVVNISLFVVVMYLNDCPDRKHTRLVGKCVARFLGRFSFEPLKENPLFGPSSSTYNLLIPFTTFVLSSFMISLPAILFL